MELQQEISIKKNKKKIGKSFKTIIESEDNENYYGRTEFNSPEVDNQIIIPKTKEKLTLNNFANIKIIDAEIYDLIGSVDNG